jgi:hypothetical protein
MLGFAGVLLDYLARILVVSQTSKLALDMGYARDSSSAQFY